MRMCRRHPRTAHLGICEHGSHTFLFFFRDRFAIFLVSCGTRGRPCLREVSRAIVCLVLFFMWCGGGVIRRVGITNEYSELHTQWVLIDWAPFISDYRNRSRQSWAACGSAPHKPVAGSDRSVGVATTIWLMLLMMQTIGISVSKPGVRAAGQWSRERTRMTTRISLWKMPPLRTLTLNQMHCLTQVYPNLQGYVQGQSKCI